MKPILPVDKYSLKFPNPLYADDEGLLAHGGDLNVNRLMSAYCSGIFPWFNEDDPILWWSPNPRFILYPDELHISKSLQRTIRKNKFEIKFDSAFVQVMIECANAKRPDQEGTWIVPEMIEAYSNLHQEGFAHSFEAWFDGELVGGGYGVVVGDIFCGESMFAKKNDASKVAFVALVQRLKQNGFFLIDSQIHTEYLEKFGAKHISREEYLQCVKKALFNPKEF
jgi:leucyl/phenylalanyl-tRNA---protein transferase